MTIIDVIQSGGVILYPTDTIWGIGGDATNPAVIDKIFQLKEREPDKSLLILVDSYKMLQKYVENIPHEVWEILEKSITPTTVVYPNPKNLPQKLFAKDGSIAIRVVKKGFAKDLIKAIGKPLISTSANLSGQKSPAHFDEIDPIILQRVDYVVNLHRKSTPAKASKIIKWTAQNGLEIIRD